MMFGVDFGRQTHVHCSRYIHLARLAGCNVTFVEYPGIERHDVQDVAYRRYPRRFRSFEKLLGTRTTHLLRKQSMRLVSRYVRPDVCHAHWFDDQLWHITQAGLRPLVATAWGSDLNYAAKLPGGDTLRQRVAAALRSIDHLIVDSDDMAATAELLAGKELCATLLPIGIDTQQFRPGLYQERKEWRERLRIDPSATVLISARQLGANYRPAEIIRAFAALDCKYRKRTYLIIRSFGHGSGVSMTELHRMAARLRVSDQIRWIGDLEYIQLPGLYAAADLAINFPVVDAFPVTFLECFACSLPVISNRLASYASNGASPYLFFVEDDSVRGVKAAVEAAIERFDQLHTLAAGAREFVVRNFDERVSACTLRQVYEAVLADVRYPTVQGRS